MSGQLQLSDVANYVPPDDDLEIIRDRLTDLLKSKRKGFPGAQPVSFSRKHLHELTKEDYYVCEKTDGIRCLLYLTWIPDEDGRPLEKAFLIDRKNDYYVILNSHFHFPRPNEPLESFHSETLVDGELVLDTYPNGRQVKRYLVFDCLALDNNLLMGRTLDKRLGFFQEQVLKPQQALLNQFPQEREEQPFEIRMKQMEKGYGIQMMFADVLPNLLHTNDGLVFTCRTSQYQTGTDPHIIKWKPPEENTIDFKLQLGAFPRLSAATNGHSNEHAPEDDDADYDACPALSLLVNEGSKRYSHFDQLYVTDDEWQSMKSLGQMLDGRVIECYKDLHHRWRYKREKDGTPRFRDDKDDANHISTVHSVLESIEDAVTEKELITQAGIIRHAWKMREQAQAQAQTQSQGQGQGQGKG